MKKKNHLKIAEDSAQTENKPLLYNDHKAPISRRDFLASGLMGMSALALTSGMGSMLSSSNAFGALMCNSGNLLCGNVPFLCLDGAGGMNIAGGNAIVGFASNQEQEEFGGNVLSDFRRLGIPDEYHPSKSGMINSSFGLKFHSTSGILQGMNEVLAPRMGDTKDLREYVDGLLLCGITNDDTQENPINTTYMAQKAGAVGDLVQLVGTSSSVSGGNSVSPSDQVNLTIKPSRLESFDSSESLLSIGSTIMGTGALSSSTSGGGLRMKKFMQLITRGGADHLSGLNRNPASAAEIQKLAIRQQGTLNVFDSFSPSALNPTTNTTHGNILVDAYGKALTAFTREEEIAANIFNLLSARIAGAATITVGGCDYHDGTALTGHSRDMAIGRHIGHMIRVAHLRNKPVFIHLFTDGGVTGDAAGQVDPSLPNRVVWRSDDGVRSAALMVVFNPNKKRVDVGDNEHSNFLIAGKTRQIGYYKIAGGNVVDAHSLSNNVSKLWIGVILNYMATLVNSTDDEEIIYQVGENFKAKFGSILPPDWRELIRLKSLVA